MRWQQIVEIHFLAAPILPIPAEKEKKEQVNLGEQNLNNGGPVLDQYWTSTQLTNMTPHKHTNIAHANKIASIVL